MFYIDFEFFFFYSFIYLFLISLVQSFPLKF